MTDNERLEILRRCRSYYERFIRDIDAGANCIVEIHICGEKHGVGNPTGCRAAVNGMLVEINKQIAELETRQ